MAFMKSGVIDHDGKTILASCPFYHEIPLCVNSCALFLPLVHEDKETGKRYTDFNFGWCGLTGKNGHLLSAVGPEDEERLRPRGKRLEK